MFEAFLIGLLGSVIAVVLTQLAFRLHRQRQIRIAKEIEAAVIAETGTNDPNAVREALDKRDPSCRLMHVYFNHVRNTDSNKESQTA